MLRNHFKMSKRHSFKLKLIKWENLRQEFRPQKLKFLKKSLTFKPSLKKTITFHTEEMPKRFLIMSMIRLHNSRNNGNKLFKMLKMNLQLSKVDPSLSGKKASLKLYQTTTPYLRLRKLLSQLLAISLLHLGMLPLLLPETNLKQKSAVLLTECLLLLLKRRHLFRLCMMTLQHKLMDYMQLITLRKHSRLL